jgi:hypothetical protein
MATHDYIISNASGAAVRADLNNALAAIATNNSSATEPTTTYAYQWWADTGSSPTVMKLRNAANSAWITLFQLDGEWTNIAFENGTAAAPSIYFKDSGTDTGLFSGGTDQVNITTGGTERVEWGTSEVVFNDSGANYDFRIEGDTNANLFFVDASADAVGIGTASPDTSLTISYSDSAFNPGIKVTNTSNTSSSQAKIHAVNNSGEYIALIRNSDALGGGSALFSTGAAPLAFSTDSTERVRIDSSGRLLVGTSSARSNFFNTTLSANLQVEGTDHDTSSMTFIRNSANTGSPTLSLCKTRGTSNGSNTAVQNGDDLGFIAFQGADGTDFVPGAYIFAQVDGTPGANDMPGRLVFSTTPDGTSTPTERMRITQVGHILFNTTDPDANVGGTPTNPPIASFKVGNGEGFRVSSTGANYWNKDNSGSVHIFRRNGTDVGSISISAGATAYNTSSDYRLKENVVPLTGAADRVNQLQVHRFNFIGNPNTTVDGFIAHEAQAVVPECVTGAKDEVDADGNPIYQGIDQSKLVPLLTAALQEAIGRIETLEAEVAALKGA